MNSRRRTLLITKDGSHTVAVPELELTFHSRHGAIQESKHVFIETGFNYIREKFEGQPLSILEIGFGTGLNAFLTAIEAMSCGQSVRYSAIEVDPLEMVMTTALNYPDQLGYEGLFNAIQLSPWNTSSTVHEDFTLQKDVADVLDFQCYGNHHLIYFDAFAPEAQPELWTEDVFRKLAACMLPGGALVTYCSKSTVRRALQAAGWKVEKVPGPLGKREIVRAVK